VPDLSGAETAERIARVHGAAPSLLARHAYFGGAAAACGEMLFADRLAAFSAVRLTSGADIGGTHHTLVLRRRAIALASGDGAAVPALQRSAVFTGRTVFVIAGAEFGLAFEPHSVLAPKPPDSSALIASPALGCARSAIAVLGPTSTKDAGRGADTGRENGTPGAAGMLRNSGVLALLAVTMVGGTMASGTGRAGAPENPVICSHTGKAMEASLRATGTIDVLRAAPA